MQRLVQGDVGSGKTIVAFLAMAGDGAQRTVRRRLMAPTEVLAQHYALLRRFLESCMAVRA